MTLLDNRGKSTQVLVLLLDDHRDTAQLLARLLETSSIHVTAAFSLAQGIFEAGRIRFDLLISDSDLPDGTGADLLVAIQRLYPIKAIAVGAGRRSAAGHARRMGFDEFFAKPFDITAVEAAIRRMTSRPQFALVADLASPGARAGESADVSSSRNTMKRSGKIARLIHLVKSKIGLGRR